MLLVLCMSCICFIDVIATASISCYTPFRGTLLAKEKPMDDNWGTLSQTNPIQENF